MIARLRRAERTHTRDGDTTTGMALGSRRGSARDDRAEGVKGGLLEKAEHVGHRASVADAGRAPTRESVALGRGDGPVGSFLAQMWKTPPDMLSFGGQVGFARRSFDDDRTVVGVWTSK